MIILYEIGDYVELEDHIGVPHELAAETVELIEKIPGSSKWVVKTERNSTVKISEDWFTNSVR